MKSFFYTKSLDKITFCFSLFILFFSVVGHTQSDEFWGMTREGGANGNGVIFKTNNTGDAYTVVHSFTASTGRKPEGSLTWFNGKLYGMTHQGGAVDSGVIFEYDPTSGVYTKKIDLNGTKGGYPSGSLTVFNNLLWGVTRYGGTDDVGVIFSYDPATNTYTKKFDFRTNISGGFGLHPAGALTPFNGKLYGTTLDGGGFSWGAIFEFDPATNAVAPQYYFEGPIGTKSGGVSWGSLVVLNNRLYGVASQGGEFDQGTLFEFLPPSGFTKKMDFTSGVSGRTPISPLIVYNNKLYGMTFIEGPPTYPNGVIYEYDPALPNPEAFRFLFGFQGPEGGNPMGALLPYNDKFYGLTRAGGTNNSGVVFEFVISTSYIAKHHFNTTDGAQPFYTALIAAPTCVMRTWYKDADGDGYGNSSNSIQACSPQSGYVLTGGDCVDFDSTIHPGAPEICDLIDNNCNGETDEGLPLYTFYSDIDGDGYGDPTKPSENECAQPPGTVANNLDCDDTDPNINPDAVEICDGKDNNCDGQTDEGFNVQTFYEDSDGDGYGKSNVTKQACTRPAGYASTGGDCNDSDAAIHPNATEVCDRVDNNCNGQTDEGLPVLTIYKDTDGDGYGNSAASSQGCLRAGFVTTGGDCDDHNAAINPGAAEVCGNGIDDNCNGQIDEGCTGNPAISINDVTVTEAQGVAQLTVSLSKTSTVAIKVSFTTVDGTAVSKGKGKNPLIDFTATKGTVNIAAGTLSATISIPVNNDGVAESAENFSVQLSIMRSTPATIAKGTGTVTILDGAGAALTQASRSNLPSPEAGFSVKALNNPSRGEFVLEVESSSNQIVQYTLTDISGKQVKKRMTSQNKMIHIGNELKSGIYLVEVAQGQNRQVLKLVKL